MDDINTASNSNPGKGYTLNETFEYGLATHSGTFRLVLTKKK